MRVLNDIAEDINETSNARAEARGIIKRLNNLESCFITIIWHDIMIRFHAVSTTLQSTNTELSVVVELYESLNFKAIYSI